ATLNLRHEGNIPIIKAYPEGGHLLEGISNAVVLEAMDVNQNPLSILLCVKNGQTIIDSVRTNKNGIGRFRFIPKKNTRYTIEEQDSKTPRPIDISLPVEENGYALKVNPQNNNTSVTIYHKGKDDSVMLALRSINNLLWTRSLFIKNGDSLTINLPITKTPKGILSLAVFDNLGNPLAERLFLNKLEDEYLVNINSDNKTYKPRQKVTVSINITDINGNPASTNLSVAVVEKNRINFKEYTSILKSYYFRPLNNIHPNQLPYNETEPDFDNYLITKKWWQNSWEDIVKYKPKGSLRIINNISGVNGQVIAQNKINDIPKLIYISYGKKKQTAGFVIQKDGTFTIEPSSLITNEQKLYLKLADDFKSQNYLKLQNYETDFDNILKWGEAGRFSEPFNILVKTRDEQKKQNLLTNKLLLQQVNIIGKNGGMISNIDINNLPPNIEAYKICDGTICSQGRFKCPLHPAIRPAVHGTRYNISEERRTILYWCPPNPKESEGILLKNISIPTEFIHPDYLKNPPVEPELQSTIFWNPNLNSNSTGKADFSFYTSDIKGEFVILVQGVEVKNIKPIYGSLRFNVL
ncbi:MAG: hypothetical protein H7Y07_01880, partial [Pyrinomonadaceae bacterium]|nr:hypothetical protein [Sphingobacteriaceae bacterium]